MWYLLYKAVTWRNRARYKEKGNKAEILTLLGFTSQLKETFIQNLAFSTFSFHSHSFQTLLLPSQSTFPKGYFIFFLAFHFLYFVKKINLQMLSLLHTDTQSTHQYLRFSGQIIFEKTCHTLTACVRFT